MEITFLFYSKFTKNYNCNMQRKAKKTIESAEKKIKKEKNKIVKKKKRNI